MRTTGIIVEYNPLHNGHIHHLYKTKQLLTPDCVIAVMSGNFVQRGEPALMDKFTRAELAIKAGVNLVVELPYIFSIQHADLFAFGAVDILNKLKVNSLCFGSEVGSIKLLEDIVNIYKSSDFNSIIKKKLKKGFSYPKASSETIKELDNNINFEYTSPNNTLGIAYIQAIHDLQSNIVPYTIKRMSSGYHDMIPRDSHITSATAIRSMYYNDQDYITYVPDYVTDTLKEYKTHNLGLYFHLLKYKLLTSSPEELRKIHDVEEGLENLFIKNIKVSTSYDEFVNKCISKRYTRGKIQRVLLHMLNNISKDEIKASNLKNGVQYIRILKMDKIGQKYMNMIKKEISTPIISKLSETNSIHASLEKKASASYSISSNDNLLSREYNSKNIVVK